MQPNKLEENYYDLDKRMSLIEQKIDTITHNHLAHLKEEVDKVTTILYIACAGLIGNLATVITILLTK